MRKKAEIVNFMMMLVIAVLINRAVCFSEDTQLWHKLLTAGLSLLLVTAEPVADHFLGISRKIGESCVSTCQNAKAYLKSRGMTAVWLLGAYLASMAGIAVLRVRKVCLFQTVILQPQFYFMAGLVTAVFFLLLFGKCLRGKEEILFLVLALTIGTSFVLSAPNTIGISQDDEAHYTRAISLAALLDGAEYEADINMLNDHEPLLSGLTDGSIRYEEMCGRNACYNDWFENGNAYAVDVFLPAAVMQYFGAYATEYRLLSIAYVPCAFGIVLGRGLGISYTAAFMLGKWFNLLAYSLILFFAIRRLKYGKNLLMIVGLMPTALFLASSYSYDWWVLSWLTLGYSCFISGLQQPEKKFSYGDFALMGVSFLLGIIPKWIYAVMLLPVFFIPKDKFESRKQRGIIYSVLAAAVLFALVYLVVPALNGNLGTGDTRGGDVLPEFQLMLIKSKPFEYADILLKTAADYLFGSYRGGWISEFGNFGTGWSYLVLVPVLFLLSFYDRPLQEAGMAKTRALALTGIFAELCAIITVFYLIFTPIAGVTVKGIFIPYLNPVVKGIQARYLTPCIFPFFYMIGRRIAFGGGKQNFEKISACFPVILTMICIFVIYFDYWNLFLKNY